MSCDFSYLTRSTSHHQNDKFFQHYVQSDILFLQTERWDLNGLHPGTIRTVSTAWIPMLTWKYSAASGKRKVFIFWTVSDVLYLGGGGGGHLGNMAFLSLRKKARRTAKGESNNNNKPEKDFCRPLLFCVWIFFLVRYIHFVLQSIVWTIATGFLQYFNSWDRLRSRNGAVPVRVLASHQCGPGSIPGLGVICGLSLLLVLVLAPRGFSPSTPVFSSPQKPPLLNSNSISKISPMLCALYIDT